jgi:hypothetical protein
MRVPSPTRARDRSACGAHNPRTHVPEHQTRPSPHRMAQTTVNGPMSTTSRLHIRTLKRICTPQLLLSGSIFPPRRACADLHRHRPLFTYILRDLVQLWQAPSTIEEIVCAAQPIIRDSADSADLLKYAAVQPRAHVHVERPKPLRDMPNVDA